MFILFILAMLFVFSTALLTPYIGKKNFISVVLLGLIVGVVAGAFLVAPMVNDLPDFTRTIIEESVDGTDTIELELSTNGNLTEIINNITSIHGVDKVDYNGIEFKIDAPFETSAYEDQFVGYLKSQNQNITSVDKLANDTYFVTMSNEADPQGVLDAIYTTFGYQTYSHLKFTSMKANATVKANNITNILAAIGENDAVILNVTGPTEDLTNTVNQFIPNQINTVLLSGLAGIIVALAGFFVDSIYTFITKFRKRNKRRNTDRERIKRKVVPGTENRRQKSAKRSKVRSDSIDIFDDSFEDSSKQTIGSNKRFKQLTEDDLKEKSINSSSNKKSKNEKSNKKSKGIFSSFKDKFSKSGSDDIKDEVKTTRDVSEITNKSKRRNKTNQRKVPRVRPKRKE